MQMHHSPPVAPGGEWCSKLSQSHSEDGVGPGFGVLLVPNVLVLMLFTDVTVHVSPKNNLVTSYDGAW